jgi:hypothetical protein
VAPGGTAFLARWCGFDLQIGWSEARVVGGPDALFAADPFMGYLNRVVALSHTATGTGTGSSDSPSESPASQSRALRSAALAVVSTALHNLGCTLAAAGHQTASSACIQYAGELEAASR